MNVFYIICGPIIYFQSVINRRVNQTVFLPQFLNTHQTSNLNLYFYHGPVDIYNFASVVQYPL